MNPDMVARIIGMVFLGVVGAVAGFIRGDNWLIYLGVGGGALGFLIAPYLSTKLIKGLRSALTQIPSQSLIAGLLGVTVALVVSALLTLPLSFLPGIWGRFLPIVLTIVLIYLGVTLMQVRGGELLQLLGLSPAALSRRTRGKSGSPILVDTSAIIDGRIADMTRTGFIPGQLVIPRFVLQELQHVADSSDPMRRRRGRRGLDMLNKIQKESEVPILISEADFEGIEAVDAKLVKLGRTWQCPILTTDFNLNRVAELEGVQVLNLNDLATALKPVVLPGEEMEIRIIQEGKEFGQGVGFLDDGTMVVVEGGRKFLNSRVDVTITRVLQTAVGRMIFAQMKDGTGRERGEKE
ncbi:MAG: PIN domain nuclease [Dehalococcoidia bacterium]|nr:PIN domain nuclease [Dehalococcoidia bacterium]MBF8304352.1 domain nuclease [Dehalococcoidia bacterium]